MSNQENQKIVNLVKQVDLLSKVVDGLQKEINEIKFKSSSDENDRSKQVTDGVEKNASALQRLRFFRRDSKPTKIDTDIDKIKLNRIDDNADDDDLNLPETKRSRRRHRNVDYKKISEENSFIEDKRSKSKVVQTRIHPDDLIGTSKIICSVKSRSVQTDEGYPNAEEDNTDQSITWEKKKCRNSRLDSSHENKTSKCTHNIQQNRCSRDCPYFKKHSKSGLPCKHRNPSNSKKCKMNCATQTPCKNEIGKSKKKIKKCKSHKNISNSCENDKNTDMDDFGIENFDTIINISDDCEKMKLKNKKCKKCSKKCTSANVVKIGKAILTRDPPVIVISPRAFKK